MRADARRNYDKILATARIVFTERGTDSSLDEIAKRAGVGPGTLYRHFPTREALVDALMQDWTDRVSRGRRRRDRHRVCPRGRCCSAGSSTSSTTSRCTGARRARSAPPWTTPPRRCTASAASWATPTGASSTTSTREGDLRPGVDAANVMRLVSGVASVADTSHADLDVRPMLEVVVDGIVRD